MDVFLGEWANLLIRWMHLIVGIGWIGTSFYFMALDYSLNKLGQKQGVLGTAWQVHGGGFYFVEKYTVAPPQLPETLHWFKWEAYLTWVSGFGLLIVQYYIHARSYLIDPSVLPLTPWQAIGISLGSILAGWAIYEGLCRSPIGQNATILAIAFFALIMGAAVFYTHVFSARGAFLHVGALTGSIMATNVFAVIVPNQRKMIAQMIQGKTPDPYYGMVGKQRSTHNNYLTLPVLVMMVSPHYPFLSAHPHAWLVVALILIAGASIRHYLNRVDAGDDWKSYSWSAPVAIGALMVAIFVTAPRSGGGGAAVSDGQVLAITHQHCVMCHAAKPTHDGFTEAPKNITLDNIAGLRQYAAQIYVQAVQTNAMPLGNETGMTDEERDALGRWVNAQK
ncbi:urate hydroxylase PuuD [Microbacteriaceae bacterium K1510]|nr:urate hydroxylase PuuD [Microbacteriaceae bacterium K1510]